MKKLLLLTLLALPAISFAEYNRNDFGGWIDMDKDCQDTRAEVLIAQSLLPAKLSANNCTVQSGLWVDPYTAKVITDPKQLDIDHKVPLKEAYESGAAKWDKSFKVSFANDLENLVAVAKESNRSKGDKNPGEWMPANVAYWDKYLADWIFIKKKWNLNLDKDKESILLLQRASVENKKGMTFSDTTEIKALVK